MKSKWFLFFLLSIFLSIFILPFLFSFFRSSFLSVFPTFLLYFFLLSIFLISFLSIFLSFLLSYFIFSYLLSFCLSFFLTKFIILAFAIFFLHNIILKIFHKNLFITILIFLHEYFPPFITYVFPFFYIQLFFSEIFVRFSFEFRIVCTWGVAAEYLFRISRIPRITHHSYRHHCRCLSKVSK